MATYSKSGQGLERHGIRAVKFRGVAERMAQVWLKTAGGLVLIYEAVRSCFGSGRWNNGKPWLGSEKWKNNK